MRGYMDTRSRWYLCGNQSVDQSKSMINYRSFDTGMIKFVKITSFRLIVSANIYDRDSSAISD